MRHNLTREELLKREKYREANKYIKDLVQSYKKTKSEQDFGMILYYTEFLVINLMLKYQRRMPHLRYIDPQEIYNTAIEGLYDSIKTITETLDPDLIPSKISSYIRARLIKYYDYLRKEETVGDSEDVRKFCEDDSVKHNVNEFVMFDLGDFVHWRIITKKEMQIVRMYIYDGLSLREISERVGYSYQAVGKRIRKAIARISDAVRRGTLKTLICNSEIGKPGEESGDADKDL